MSVVHAPRVRGWRCDDGYRARLAATSLAVPAWPFPVLPADPARRRRVRARRVLRAADRVVGLVLIVAVVVLYVGLAVVAPIAYEVLP